MPTLVTCTYQGLLYTVDQNSGATSLIGNTGFYLLNSLACNSSGILYSVGGVVSVGSVLITSDVQTGAGTFVAYLSPDADIRDMDFSASDVLFAIRHNQTGAN